MMDGAEPAAITRLAEKVQTSHAPRLDDRGVPPGPPRSVPTVVHSTAMSVIFRSLPLAASFLM
jgi:hypothetical protein